MDYEHDGTDVVHGECVLFHKLGWLKIMSTFLIAPAWLKCKTVRGNSAAYEGDSISLKLQR